MSQVWSLPGLITFFVEIDQEMFSMIILSFPLIQEGQFSIFLVEECAQLLVISLEV